MLRVMRLSGLLLLLCLSVQAVPQQQPALNPEQEALINKWIALPEAELDRELEANKNRLTLDFARFVNQKGNYDLARDYHLRALKLKRKVGSPSEISLTLSNLAMTEQAVDNMTAAEEYFREAMAINEKTGDRRALSLTLVQ